MIRPFSLGIRLFGNMFADEKVAHTVSGLFPWILPVFLMPLGVFVAFIQTFVFILLSQLYLSEVSHSAHGEEHADHEPGPLSASESHGPTEQAALAV